MTTNLNTTPPKATLATTTLTTTNATAANSSNSSTNANNVTNDSLSDSLTNTEGHRTPNVENLSKTNLYIRGLAASTSDQDLYNMCARFGNIFSTKAILDKVNGGCKGYGFVQFTSPHSAELAVQELTKSGIQAQMAKISPGNSSHNHHHPHHNQYHNQNAHHHNQHHHHQHNSGNNNHNNSNNLNPQSHNQNSSNNNHNNNNNADPTNLYIANLPLNMNEQELENLLSTYGPVVSTRILRDQISNNPRGVGFARMESRDKCQEIIEKLNGKPCKGSKEPLLVKFADGGNKKRHHHNNQHHSSNHHQQHHKLHQDDSRWRESGNAADLAIMGTLSYPRIQPAFPPAVPPGAAYPTTMGPSTSGPQWIHPGTGQPWNMIPQQMIQPGSLNPSNQAASFPFGHIPQLTSQMQGLQIAHHPTPVGGYLAPQHQWSALWPHPLQPQPPSMRLASSMQPPPPPQQQQQQQQQPAPSHAPHQSPQPSVALEPLTQQKQSVADTKLQVSAPL